MTDLFDDDDEIIDEESFSEDINLDEPESSILDARRRWEQLLEDHRLRDELDDYADY